MAYYDIFIAPIHADKRADYDAFLKASHEMILGYGATEVVDLWGDDVNDGKLTSLPMAVKLEAGEVVTAGYVIWPSKDVRDAGWEKMMSEAPEMEMPFDGKRMIFGGFSELMVSRG
ncbi:hypothetical protein FIU94_14150 [Sulfitobacter sp. THAF37]|uniref:DUF1428 domain-containing protein n=1 Tax=Sulfitobacter sp. THAF37 TaxID=2587855 RepID=UPI00126983A1|nr:DUF1428 domain-containing protein [Sulfitobacter sp. THAF37]QFT59970.1 hypothetical protein FIU94_14150 [Sulfitobacter sp. THAF37]